MYKKQDLRITNDWFTNRARCWLRLFKKFNVPITRALEIGCYEGLCTLWLLEHTQAKVVAIDTFEGSLEHRDGKYKTDFSKVMENFLHNTSGHDSRLTLMVGKSQEILPTIFGKFDFVYIDGSHLGRDVMTDAVMSWNLLEDGGVMIFDDYEWEGADDFRFNTKIAINGFLMLWSGQYELIGTGGQIALRKHANWK